MTRRDPLFLCLLVLYAVYAGVGIENMSFTLGGVRTFTLFDDAMISMRYAHNLSDGYGLVWNPGGARVEGYTNFLWVVYMALLHRLPLPPQLMSLPVQITGALLMLVNIIYVRRLALLLTGGSRAAGLCAALLTGLYYSLNFWAWNGMETSAATLILTVASYTAARDITQGRTVGFLPFALLSVGTFVRPDMALPLLLLTVYAAWASTGADKRRMLVRGFGLTVVCMSVQTLGRILYFHDPLPNTYYLKMAGYPPLLRMGRGVWEMAKFTVQGLGLPVLAPLFTVRWGRDGVKQGRGLLALLWAGQFCYNIYTGGDAWEYWGHASRFVTVAVPLLLVLLTCAVHDVLVRYGVRPVRLAWAAAACGLVVVMDMLYYPPVAREIAGTFVVQSRTAEAAAFDDDAAFARAASVVDTVSAPSATVAVMRAGILPYFAGRNMFDLLGKCDAHIAHEPMHRWTGGGRRTVTDFVPGHMKWDWAYTLNTLRPDIVADPFGDPEKRAVLGTRFLRLTVGNVTLHLRRGCPRILWARVRGLAARPGSSLTDDDGHPASV